MYSHYSGHLKPKCVSHFDQTSEESVSETGPQTTEDSVLETGPKQLTLITPKSTPVGASLLTICADFKEILPTL